MKLNLFKKLLLYAILVMILFISTTCSTNNGDINYYLSEQEAYLLADEFVRNSPTFKYDGIQDTLRLEETLYPDIENAWQFIFSFESSHAGYGDRTGQILAQVITPHEVVIMVEQGKIKTAIMDGSWDMLKQNLIGMPES